MNKSWEQVVGSSFACLFVDHLVCKIDNSEISAVEPRVLMLRVGGSPRGWFNEKMKEKKLDLADKVYDVVSDSASVERSNQKFFVISVRAGDCIADSMRRQVARKDKEERELNPANRRLQWWGKPCCSLSATVSSPGPVDSCGDQSKPEGKCTGKGKKKEGKNAAASAHVMTQFLLGGPVSVGRIVSCPLPSRHPLVETEVILSTSAIPFPASPFQNLCWAVLGGLWTALSCVNYMNVCAG